MDLEQWCRQSGTTYTEVAEELGIHPSRVSLWARGMQFPRTPEVFEKLFAITGGEVTAASMHERFRAERLARSKPPRRITRLAAAS